MTDSTYSRPSFHLSHSTAASLLQYLSTVRVNDLQAPSVPASLAAHVMDPHSGRRAASTATEAYSPRGSMTGVPQRSRINSTINLGSNHPSRKVSAVVHPEMESMITAGVFLGEPEYPSQCPRHGNGKRRRRRGRGSRWRTFTSWCSSLSVLRSVCFRLKVPVSTRVLLVEDSLTIQNIMVRWFKMNGCPVEVASNGQEGLSYLTAKGLGFDLVLMDFMMVS